MLTFDDAPAIRGALIKKLGAEPGIAIADLKVQEETEDGRNYIAVGVWLILTDRMNHGGVLDIKSFFDLPSEFTQTQLDNEIDEISEACKAAKRTAGLRVLFNPTKTHRELLPGTGRRGSWNGVMQ